MDNERILKRSLFGGFRREDVLNYIEKLQSENVALAEELRAKSWRVRGAFGSSGAMPGGRRQR